MVVLGGGGHDGADRVTADAGCGQNGDAGWQRIAANFDECDFPDDMMDIWVETESAYIVNAREQLRKRGKSCGDSGETIPGDARMASINLLVQLSWQCGADQADIGKAIGLLDLVSAHLPKEEALQRLPANTITVFRLVQALDGGGRRLHPIAYFSAQKEFTKYLVKLGHLAPLDSDSEEEASDVEETEEIAKAQLVAQASDAEEADEIAKAQLVAQALAAEEAALIAKAQLVAQERAVLEMMEWRIAVITAEDWLRAFCCRLNLVTNGAFKPSLNWVLEQSMSLSTVVMLEASALDLPPRALALGALCHRLIYSRLISVDIFRRPGEGDEWVYLFSLSQPGHQLPHCALNLPTQLTLMRGVEASTGVSEPELRRSLLLLLTHFAPRMCAQATARPTPAGMCLRA